jgi:hypothetical protein
MLEAQVPKPRLVPELVVPASSRFLLSPAGCPFRHPDPALRSWVLFDWTASNKRQMELADVRRNRGGYSGAFRKLLPALNRPLNFTKDSSSCANAES